MINKEILANVLKQYKKEYLNGHWDSEKYKWQIVKHFQDNWNIEAEDFPEMLEKSLETTDNLLTSVNYFPKGMICGFARLKPEVVRGMFRDLYDENKDVYERIKAFKDKSAELLKEWEEYHNSSGKEHYQKENSITTYLWLRYPDKYYIYKFGEVKTVNEVLEAGYIFKKGEYRENINNFLSFYNELRSELAKDDELIQLFQSNLDNTCYPDPIFTTLTFDVGFYIGRTLTKKGKIRDDEEPPTAMPDNKEEQTRYWMYAAGNSSEKWDEYYEKGIMGIGWSEIGDLSQYHSKDEMKKAMQEHIDPTKSYKMSALATWQFSHVMKPGDIIYVKKGVTKVVGRGIVESDYYYDPTDEEYCNLRNVKWTHKGEWDVPREQIAVKTLTNITRYTEIIEQLESMFDSEADIEEEEKSYDPYDVNDFLEEVYIDKDSYDTLVNLVREKKNVILQGAPGVGKTFIAKRLAYSMIGSKNRERVMMVQFHQSYSYEDFIEGLRPSRTGMGFEIKNGAFLNFCQIASDDLDNEYFFIIDEINRGNLSKIFGELFMLIENDKRGNELQLLYSGNRFSVPENLYIIGMMNTADRSLALLDYALRRRFAFYDIAPGFNTEGFKSYKESLNSPKFNKLIDCVQSLNQAIKEDETLGEGFCIGHSYLCNITEVTDKKLSSIVEFEIIPLLKEYWFDEPSKVRDWSERLRSSIQ